MGIDIISKNKIQKNIFPLGFLLLSTAILLIYFSGCGRDFEKPSPPSNLRAEKAQAGISFKAILTWDEVSGVSSYNVYYRINKEITRANAIKIPRVTSPYTHDSLSADTYYYIATSVNGEWESIASNQVSVNFTVDQIQKPSNVIATAGDGQITITWIGVGGATSYNIYWATSPGVTTFDNLIPGVTSPYMHTGLNNGTTYYYALTTVGVLGESGLSNEVQAMPKAPVTVPSFPTGITVSQTSGSSAMVTWTDLMDENIAGYNVYYGTHNYQIDQKANGALVTSQVEGVGQYEVSGLNKGITYYLAVKSADDVGTESELSEYKSIAIIPRAPLPPDPSEILEGQYLFVLPEAICLSRDGLRAYVTNPANKVVSLIDLTTVRVVGDISVGDHPIDLAANPVKNEVYCVNHESNTVMVIDSTSSQPESAVIRTYQTASAPTRCLVSSDGKYLFVSCIGEGADSITVIDLDTGNEIDESPIAVGGDPQGMTIAKKKLYVANEADNNVSVIDIDPNSATKWQRFDYNVQVGDSPQDLATREDGAFVYVANWGEGTIELLRNKKNFPIKAL